MFHTGPPHHRNKVAPKPRLECAEAGGGPDMPRSHIACKQPDMRREREKTKFAGRETKRAHKNNLKKDDRKKGPDRHRPDRGNKGWHRLGRGIRTQRWITLEHQHSELHCRTTIIYIGHKGRTKGGHRQDEATKRERCIENQRDCSKVHERLLVCERDCGMDVVDRQPTTSVLSPA